MGSLPYAWFDLNDDGTNGGIGGDDDTTTTGYPNGWNPAVKPLASVTNNGALTVTNLDVSNLNKELEANY